ncbi:tetratricopeptide repeat protein [bacterium]|nr:tetratricopeptide repeat protein [bacterium]
MKRIMIWLIVVSGFTLSCCATLYAQDNPWLDSVLAEADYISMSGDPQAVIEYYKGLQPDHIFDKYTIYKKLAYQYHQIREWDSSLVYFRKSLELAEELSDTSSMGNLSLWIGNTYKYLNQFSEQLEKYKTAENYFMITGEDSLLELAREYIEYHAIDTTSWLAGLASAKFDYFETLRLANLVLEDLEAKGDPQRLWALYMVMGDAYYYTSDYNNSLKYKKNALEAAYELDDKMKIQTSLNVIGSVYLNTGQFDTALSYYQEAYTLAVELGNLNAQGYILLNIGQIL